MFPNSVLQGPGNGQKPMENPLRIQWYSLHILTPLVTEWLSNGFEKIRKWLKMVRIGIRLYSENTDLENG